ncbi:MAG: site-specific integrase [Bacteroidetes bacterium]|nr:site-specific integrase [Bacteroidota bacterium]
MILYNVTIGQDKKQPFINVYYNNKRYRFWNGKIIGLDLKARNEPELLKAAFELKLRKGWRPKPRVEKKLEEQLSVVQALERAVTLKISQRCSERFIKDASRVVKLWIKFEAQEKIVGLQLNKLEPQTIKKFLVRPTWSSKTQRTVKSTLSPLLNEFRPGIVSQVKLKKPISSLHKPFDDVRLILNDIKEFNKNLYLCCLMTYGCLLRPHREIRELTWGDFTDDLSYINLSGSRNKSGRNRIVPVPSYIKEELSSGESNLNIFSGKDEPHNGDYFKTLWSRYKKQSDLIEEGQTLYSFRHSGAIDIFKRTGSITKLQKAMGHSSINVSLTYLRGLEIAGLKEEDMPMI